MNVFRKDTLDTLDAYIYKNTLDTFDSIMHLDVYLYP